MAETDPTEKTSLKAEVEHTAAAVDTAVPVTTAASKDEVKPDDAKAKDDVGDIPDVAQLLDNIVLEALKRRSSDVHIEPTETSVIVRYRIDGLLRDIFKISKHSEQPLLFKIKVSAKLRTDEHFAPQDGRIRFKFPEGKYVDTRVSILPTTKGEKVVMRLLTQEGKSFTLEELGMRGKDLAAVQKSYMKPYGTILAVGPTGSGKTTTLYSILKTVNSREKNITTIEDPVEYDIEGVNHIQINVKTDLTFANGLRSILRQDPDIVMVGEIRDSETARIAINAAMTGHLVLSTLHTNDALTTIPRLEDMGIEPFLVASTINVIIAQRLARLLCTHCKQEYALSGEDYEYLITMRKDIAKFIKSGTKLFHKVGCKECGGVGYKGRIGLYEVLEINETIRRMINDKANIDDIYKTARDQGLVLIVEDGIEKLKQGTIDLNELIRVTALKE